MRCAWQLRCKARELSAASGRTLAEVGLAMGFRPEGARTSGWQLLNEIDGPKLSISRKFAAVLGVEMSVFFPDGKRAGRSDRPIVLLFLWNPVSRQPYKTHHSGRKGSRPQGRIGTRGVSSIEGNSGSPMRS